MYSSVSSDALLIIWTAECYIYSKRDIFESFAFAAMHKPRIQNHERFKFATSTQHFFICSMGNVNRAECSWQVDLIGMIGCRLR